MVLDLTERKRVWLFFHKTVVSHHDIPISITMLPDIGGTVEVTVTAPAYKWVDQPSLTISQTKTTPNGNSDHGNHFWTQWDISTPVNPHSPPREGDEHISRADITSIIESNPGCSQFNNHSFSVSPDGTHATLTWENWGWPVTITFSAFVQVWTHVGDTTTTGSTTQFPLGGNFELHLPLNFTHASILVKRYDGRTETLDLSRSTNIDVPPIPNPGGRLISYIGNYPTASDLVYTFASLQPITIEAAYTKLGPAEVHLPASFKSHP